MCSILENVFFVVNICVVDCVQYLLRFFILFLFEHWSSVDIWFFHMCDCRKVWEAKNEKNRESNSEWIQRKKNAERISNFYAFFVYINKVSCVKSWRRMETENGDSQKAKT